MTHKGWSESECPECHGGGTCAVCWSNGWVPCCDCGETFDGRDVDMDAVLTCLAENGHCASCGPVVAAERVAFGVRDTEPPPFGSDLRDPVEDPFATAFAASLEIAAE